MDHLHKRYPENKNKCHCADRRSRVTVVPCLYAWFNIAASWDPYGNTGNLKVAVASVDEGYTGNLIPLQLNLGDQVLSALRENTQLNWYLRPKAKQ